MNERLGGALARRPLHLIYLIDCSGSMGIDGKMEALNNAVRDSLPEVRRLAADAVGADIKIRIITFSNGARWHIAQPISLDDFEWTNIAAEPLAVTDIGHALQLLADQMKIPPMENRGLPPVFLLLSDGQPTDDFSAGLRSLMEQNWGKKAVRIAVAIGRDADLEVLQKFIGQNNAGESLPVLQANNAEQLAAWIKFGTVTALQGASRPATQPVGGSNETPVPPPLPSISEDDADGMW